MVLRSLAAAAEVAGDGIEAEVIDLRTIKPLDSDTVIESVRRKPLSVESRQRWMTVGLVVVLLLMVLALYNDVMRLFQ